ncbi:MAG: hypothetical protein KDI71_17965, partial [Xanthomonadales bacterium]|nr:hypothetical protein [Xanthomonadales bacterium]
MVWTSRQQLAGPEWTGRGEAQIADAGPQYVVHHDDGSRLIQSRQRRSNVVLNINLIGEIDRIVEVVDRLQRIGRIRIHPGLGGDQIRQTGGVVRRIGGHHRDRAG